MPRLPVKAGQPESPVVVIGMHRSGTRVVAGALTEMGVFQGHWLQRDHESVFFMRVNRWMLTKSGGRWDYPEPFDRLLDDPVLRSAYGDTLRALLRSPLALGYLGWSRYARCRDVARITYPWGWKDPRTTFTLPLWLDVFPDARVVHVIRHGVDVAASLLARREAVRDRAESMRQRHPGRYLLRVGYGRFGGPTRFHDVPSAVALWELYVRRARQHLDALPSSRKLEMRFEDLAAEPHAALTSLARFAGVDADPALLDRIATTVDPNRRFGYRRDDVLSRESERLATTLRTGGYEP